MRPFSPRVVHALLRRMGWRSSDLGDSIYAVESGKPPHMRVRLGPEDLDTHLVTRRRRTRDHWGRHAYERALLRHAADEHVAWILRRLRINVVLDVGANQGQFATSLRRSGYRGRIVSFEPVGEFVERLRDAAAEDPDWQVVPCALGDEPGTAEINLAGTMSSMLTSSDFGRHWKDALDTTRTETITVRRLADVLDDAVAGIEAPRIFLKMDTQGFDLAAFRGAGDRIGSVLALQSEVSVVPIYDGMPRFPEQLAEYEEAGFEISGIFPVTTHIRSMRVIEFDLMMVRDLAEGPPSG